MTALDASDRRSQMSDTPLIKHLGLVEYEPTWRAMQAFTNERGAGTRDEIWMAEHPAVFTLGLNASREHLLNPGAIPVVQVDRGGQVTYHGPGQLMIYPLIDLRRHVLSVRQLVVALENAVIGYAAELGVSAAGSREAPGVYVGGAKLASVGLRIRRGASYHGMALNVAVDLGPFGGINVCGYRGLAVTRLADLCGVTDLRRVADELAPHVLRELGFERGAVTGPGAGASSDAVLGAAAAGTSPAGTLGACAGTATDAPRPGRSTGGHNAISTNLQAVNSR